MAYILRGRVVETVVQLAGIRLQIVEFARVVVVDGQLVPAVCYHRPWPEVVRRERRLLVLPEGTGPRRRLRSCFDKGSWAAVFEIQSTVSEPPVQTFSYERQRSRNAAGFQNRRRQVNFLHKPFEHTPV